PRGYQRETANRSFPASLAAPESMVWKHWTIRSASGLRREAATVMAKAGGWTKTRPVSLGLLPSGPDPIGERCVLRQPPWAYVDHSARGRKGRVEADQTRFGAVCLSKAPDARPQFCRSRAEPRPSERGPPQASFRIAVFSDFKGLR